MEKKGSSIRLITSSCILPLSTASPASYTHITNPFIKDKTLKKCKTAIYFILISILIFAVVVRVNVNVMVMVPVYGSVSVLVS